MGPQHIWKAKTKKNQKTIDAQLIKKNAKVLKNIERQQKQAKIPETIKYQYIQVRTIIKYLIITIVN